jgi:CheY-like chemotaxis protein
MSSDNKKSINNNNNILLVDDEYDACLVYKIVLEENGFKVDSFEDPLLALPSFKPHSYALAILDIKMPKMSGFELYREIRKIDPEVKVCFLTASKMYHEDYRKNEVAVGGAGGEDIAALDKALFLLKPISNQGLIQQVNKIMNC